LIHVVLSQSVRRQDINNSVLIHEHLIAVSNMKLCDITNYSS